MYTPPHRRPESAEPAETGSTGSLVTSTIGDGREPPRLDQKMSVISSQTASAPSAMAWSKRPTRLLSLLRFAPILSSRSARTDAIHDPGESPDRGLECYPSKATAQSANRHPVGQSAGRWTRHAGRLGAAHVPWEVEATSGFEPLNRGFADLPLRPLGYVASDARRRGPADAEWSAMWLPLEDSNLGSRIQSPLSYH
jgi:hypothetical protein